jgi:2-polyprenyl-3-methyl-5-hydroxy-6-metoxy-1,4-benzoquinol methylase
VSRCCYEDEYGDVFTTREAARRTRRYERRGLRGVDRPLVDGIVSVGIEGRTVLEVGGGAGTIHSQLLRDGAVKALNVDLSPSWDGAARQLISHLGLEDRVERRLGDVVELADELPVSDVVVLHAVICCYPHWRDMVDAATSLARETIGLTLPRDRWVHRALIAIGNRFLALRGRQFRAFVHPVEDVIARVQDAGFTIASDRSRPFWRTIVFTRDA